MKSLAVNLYVAALSLRNIFARAVRGPGPGFEQAERVLLLATYFGLGNAILLMPLVVSLSKSFPKMKVDVFTKNPVAAELFRLSGLFANVYIDETAANLREEIAYFKTNLAPRQYDLLIQTFLENDNSRIAAHFVRAKRSLVHGAFGLSKYLSTDIVAMDQNLHEVERYLEIVREMGGNVIDDSLGLVKSLCDHDLLNEFLNENRINDQDLVIGIHPGTALATRNKCWSVKKFADLADGLVRDQKARVVFFFGAEDADLMGLIKERVSCKHCYVVDESLLKVFSIIGRTALFISNDSGLMHAAAAAKVPTVAIFGPTIPNKNYPWQVKHRIVRRRLACSPCYQVGRGFAKDCNNQCLKKITVNEVLAVAKMLLNLSYSEGKLLCTAKN